MTASKIVLNAASGVGGAGLDVEDVFSTNLYTGNNSALTVNTGLDQNTEGGMLWVKSRSTGSTNHGIWDTERTNGYYLPVNSSDNGGNISAASGTNPFLRDGSFRWNAGHGWFNQSGDYVAWAFRKAPKFFDVVTYTGNGASSRAISHNLNSTPGMIIIKQTSSGGENWIVWHRSISNVSNGEIIYLNATDSESDMDGKFDGANLPTSTTFTIEQDNSVNASGASYVAYLFAHNDGDGDFGPDGNADIIKCGTYEGNGGTQEIDLGFEPQWVMIKNIESRSYQSYLDWNIFDNMREFANRTSGDNDVLIANGSDAETALARCFPTANGFAFYNDGAYSLNTSGDTYIYIAIRRGTKVPESGTEVFNIDTYGGTSPNPPAWTSGFPVDMALWKAVNSASYSTFNAARLISGKYLQTAATNAEVSMASHVFDYQNGWNSDTGSNSNSYSWMWKRAPGFFDVVAYTGDGTTARAISHNLGVPPQLMIHKRRNATNDWYVPDFINSKLLFLNDPAAANTTAILANYYGSGNGSSGGASSLVTPNASTFTVTPNINVNGSGDTYVVYLFASLDGVSKVGSYTGNGSTQTIDCGFSAGARFVLIKKTNGSGSWLVFDTERGIVSGNDPYFELNETATQNSTTDYMDPDNSGFVLTQNGLINGSSDTYIFYAIA